MRRWAAAVWLALTPVLAAAHPLDEVVQGAYLTLAPGELRLELNVTPGSEVAARLLRELDPNRDRRITELEGRAWARRVLAQSGLTLDGRAVRWTLVRVGVPPYEHLQGESDTLKIHAVARRPDRAGSRTLAYENRYQPARSQHVANIFLQPGRGWTYAVAGQQRGSDGRTLTLRYTSARP